MDAASSNQKDCPKIARRIFSQLQAYRGDPSALPAVPDRKMYAVENEKFKRNLSLNTALKYAELLKNRAKLLEAKNNFPYQGFMISRIFLFGSALRGKPNPNDVDIRYYVAVAISFFHRKSII